MIFDTGSSWVWVGTDKCYECHNPEKFHYDHSMSFIQASPKISNLRYGRGAVWGYDSYDTVCLSEQSTIGNGCMENYLFKSVVYQEELGGLAGAGLIGLAPSSQFSGSQLFVPSLYEKGAIKNNMFSLFIDQTNVSKIQIGGYDLKKYASGPLKWYKITDPVFWMLNFDNVKLGNHTFSPSTNRIMADSGTSLNMVPDVDFFKIKNMFFSDKNCYVLPNTLTACDCTKEEHESIPDLTFEVKGDTYVMNRDMWYERKDNTCVIKFMHAPGRDEWILGVNFF